MPVTPSDLQTVAANALSYPLADTLPAEGTAIDVTRGVRWLRMPLPFALDHINLWLLRDRVDGRDGWAIVDCGIADEATRSAWERLFATGLEGLPVLRVIVTHFHPDHMGLSHWLTQRWSTAERECPLWISPGSWQAARTGSTSDSDVGGPGAAEFFRLHGLADAESLRKVSRRGDYYAKMVPAVPEHFTRLADGLSLDVGDTGWRCIAGDGHAPEHISFYSPTLGALISGDMILPRISTNVSVVFRNPDANPLQLYLASIARLRELPEDTLVLPSHGRPFRGLHVRIAELEAHHEARLAEVRAACATEPRSAAGLLGLLFRRKLDLQQTTFAMGEAIAHLHALEALGELKAERGDDGVIRFAAV